MTETLKELRKLYIIYENLYSLENKINLIFKIDELENKIFNFPNHNFIADDILYSLDKKYIFNFSQQIYILSKLELNSFLQTKVEKLFLNLIIENLSTKRKIPYISHCLKGFKLLSESNSDFFRSLFENKDFLSLYSREIIIAYSKVSSKEEDFIFLFSLLKKFPFLKEEIYWGIGSLASPIKNIHLKRIIIDEYIKYTLKYLKKYPCDNMILENIFYSLLEISLIQSRISGNIFNQTISTLIKYKTTNIFQIMLLKSLNNTPLSQEEIFILNKKRNLY